MSWQTKETFEICRGKKILIDGRQVGGIQHIAIAHDVKSDFVEVTLKLFIKKHSLNIEKDRIAFDLVNREMSDKEARKFVVKNINNKFDAVNIIHKHINKKKRRNK